MKKLIVVRHGDYGIDGCLNQEGKSQISTLIEYLKGLVGSCRVYVLTSPLPRAKESAKLIADAFAATGEVTEILRPLFYEIQGERFNPVLDLIRSRGDQVDVLILVTHVDYTEAIVENFTEEEWGQDLLPGGGRLGKGGAWVVDCEKRELLVRHESRHERR